MRKQPSFGGNWTEEKLARLAAYLPAYTKILRRTPFYTTWYVDGFASGGHRLNPGAARLGGLFGELDEPETQGFVKGSARKPLETVPEFGQFLFVDLDQNRCLELSELREDYVDKATRIQIENREANEFITEWCRTTDWRRNRALMFLDPFGLQVEWPLLQAIARTEAIDLWLLFPLGAGINRLLTKNELPPTTWADKVTACLGTEDWKNEFYTPTTVQTLFGEEEKDIKSADWNRIGAFFLRRLKTIFAGVLETPYTLRNSRNVPLYLLCFCVANPKPSVQAATMRISRHILGR